MWIGEILGSNCEEDMTSSLKCETGEELFTLLQEPLLFTDVVWVRDRSELLENQLGVAMCFCGVHKSK